MLLEKLNGTKPVLADSTTIADLTADENVTNTGMYSKTCLKWPLKNRKNKGLKDK